MSEQVKHTPIFACPNCISKISELPVRHRYGECSSEFKFCNCKAEFIPYIPKSSYERIKKERDLYKAKLASLTDLIKERIKQKKQWNLSEDTAFTKMMIEAMQKALIEELESLLTSLGGEDD